MPEEFEDFIDWYQNLSDESLDMAEAMEIYFNRDIYEEII